MGNDLHVVAVAVSSTRESVEKMVKSEGLEYPIYFAPQHLSSTYRVASLPTTYVVNARGSLVDSSTGFLPGWELKRMLGPALEHSK